MAKVVGITGVMGAGKSTVAGVLEMMGVKVYNCDKRAKEIMVSDCVDDLKKLLGDEVLTDTGELNRTFISSKIFSDSGLKVAVEEIVHTALRKDMNRWIEKYNSEKFVLIESAILLSSIIADDMDMIVGVVANEDELIGRIALRDGLKKEQIEARLKTQMSQNEIKNRADEVVFTANNELITPKVVELHKKIITFAL